jgi:hypothetical protein
MDFLDDEAMFVGIELWALKKKLILKTLNWL